MKKAVVFVSGGVDSTTCLSIAKHQGYACYALTFNYAQRHAIEIEYAKKIANLFSTVEHRICHLDIASHGSSLINSSLSVSDAANMQSNTYVPARNTIFLSHALSWAEVLDAPNIFIGVNADDYAQYPDCRLDYINAFENLARFAVRESFGNKLKIHAPLIKDSKVDIILRGHALGVDYSQTWSCYDPTEDLQPCGNCGACLLRDNAFSIIDS